MGVPLTEGSSTMEKELRHDNKCYYRKQVVLWQGRSIVEKIYNDGKPVLLWKPSSVYYYVEVRRKFWCGQFKFHLRRKFYCGKELPYKKDFLSGKGKEFGQKQEVLFLQRTFYYEKEIWFWKNKTLLWEGSSSIWEFH